MEDISKLIQHSKKLKVLYVEDNEELREMISLVLYEFFDDIIMAIDGKDGFSKFKNNKIDLIITDINMPNLNGLEMTKKIRIIDNEIPILILSAYNETKYFTESIKLGIDGYLLKPLDMKQFLAVLNKCVKNITMKNKNIEYKQLLEKKIETQVVQLKEKDAILMQQSKMAAMGEMVDAIAHQWKQPLNVVFMATENIEYDIKKDSINKNEFLENTELIKQQIDYLLDTMSEFRNFFRPNNNIETINLNQLLNSMTILLKDELLKNRVELNIIYDKSIYIKVNKNDIKHLFVNLINNAKEEIAKHNLDNDKRFIEISLEEVDEKVTILVKDFAKGVPKEIQKNIFKANFTTKKDDGGTGIGLYMCQQIVNKYHGNISVYNDNGAVFKIVFDKKIL